MIRSMTAFARAECQTPWGSVTWELRSVNHRYLETTLRLPETLRALEPQVRERLAGALNRGRVDGSLKFQAEAESLSGLSLNRPLVERLLVLAGEADSLMGAGTGLRTIDVLRWPGAVSEPEPDLEAVGDAVLQALDQTLAELVTTRAREGERIAAMILSRVDAMGTLVGEVRARRPQVVSQLRDKLLARLRDIPLEPDPARLEQEMAIVAQRLDVAEELDRLDAHLSETRAVLKRKEPVGRRLDFLMQELNREANTLSSKSADAETTRAAVELKVLIEQMREQVQNIE